MTIAQKKAVRNHRRRLKERGIVRLEVQTPEADKALIRKIASLLRGDPARAAWVRARLRRAISDDSNPGLKALLASAPLEGIDLTRDRDLGRSVDL